MKFVRDASVEQIRDAFRDALKGGNTETWINYFGDTRSGQDYVISWTPGIGLESKVAGSDQPTINNKALASAIFSIWLGDKPIQDDIKKASSPALPTCSGCIRLFCRPPSRTFLSSENPDISTLR